MTWQAFRKNRLVQASTTAITLSIIALPTSAHAGTTSVDGNWWYSAYHVPAAQASGWTGKGIRIAVIDDQIDPSFPGFSGANLNVDNTPMCEDPGASVSVSGDINSVNFHGSSITSLLIGNGTGAGQIQGISPGASVEFIGFGVSGSQTQCAQPRSGDEFGSALAAAIASKPQIITTSIGTGSLSPSATSELAKAFAQGIVVVASQADNSSSEDYFPAVNNGVVAVNGVDSSGNLMAQSNSSSPNVELGTTIVAAGTNIAIPISGHYGQGASFAAPLVAGMIADVWQKYPHATGSQIIQSMIRNTGAGLQAEPNYDSSGKFGYGSASLTSMLEVDPTRYPNVNPLMNKGSSGNFGPSQAQVNKFLPSKDDSDPRSLPTRASSKDSRSFTKDGELSIAGWVVAVLVILVILAVAALVIILISFRSRRTRHKNPSGEY